jgi:hypothetical protein
VQQARDRAALLQAADEAARALLKLRGELLAHLRAFDFRDNEHTRLSPSALAYLRSLPAERRRDFAVAAADRFRAALDHALARYEAQQERAQALALFGVSHGFSDGWCEGMMGAPVRRHVRALP